MIIVYGVPTCDKIKKTISLLKTNNIEFEFINVRNTPIPEEELKKITNQLGLDAVVNKKGMLYRKRGLKDKNLSEKQLFEELLKEQGMIKRPLIKNHTSYQCGYDEEAILNFIQ